MACATIMKRINVFMDTLTRIVQPIITRLLHLLYDGVVSAQTEEIMIQAVHTNVGMVRQ